MKPPAATTQTTPTAVNNIATTGDSSLLVLGSGVTVKSKVILNLTCQYNVLSENVTLRVVNHATSAVVAEIPVTAKQLPNGRYYYQPTFDDVGAREMRVLYDFTLYDGDTAVSKTLTWSVESYVASVRSNANSSATQIALCDATLTYGDAVAAHLTATGH